MQTKVFSITLDMMRTLTIHPFEVVECDTGNVLHIQLQNDGVPMDLSDCDVCLVFGSSAGFAMQDLTSGISMGEGTGDLTVTLYPESYGAGDVRADLQVYSGTDRACLITSRRFTFRCITSLINPGIVAAQSAYPPLVAATRAATEAAAAANDAAARIFRDIGEMNVQSDWQERDAASDAFIKNKPAIPSTPADVGAMAADAVPVPASHASSHASAGADPVTPVSIGAERARLQYQNVVVSATSFVADETYEDYPFRAAVVLSGVTADMTPEVTLSCADVLSGVFAPVSACYAGGVYLYASEVPEANITVPTIILWKHVSGADERAPEALTLSVLDQAEYDALQAGGGIASDCLYLIRG